MAQNLKMLWGGLFLTLGAAAPASANCVLCNDQQYPACIAVMEDAMTHAMNCLDEAHRLQGPAKRKADELCEEQLAQGLKAAQSQCTMMKKK